MILKRMVKIAIVMIAFCTTLNVSLKAETLSMVEQITQLEESSLGQKYENEIIIRRLERLEDQILGSIGAGSFLQRINALTEVVNKDKQSINNPVLVDKTSKPDIPGLIDESKRYNNLKEDKSTKKKQKKQKKKKNEEEKIPEFDPNASSYYDILMYVNKDKVIRWKKMPLKVFLPSGNNITYLPHYRNYIVHALNIWKIKSKGVFDYLLVDKPKNADIVVIWQDHYIDSQVQEELNQTRVGYNQTQAVTGNAISQSGMFMPGYFGYGASLLGALVGGLNNNRAKIRDVKIIIGTMPAMKLPKDNARNHLLNLSLREIGHAAGINCFSNNPIDIMFSELPAFGQYLKFPSQRDIETLQELYSKEADITN